MLGLPCAVPNRRPRVAALYHAIIRRGPEHAPEEGDVGVVLHHISKVTPSPLNRPASSAELLNRRRCRLDWQTAVAGPVSLPLRAARTSSGARGRAPAFPMSPLRSTPSTAAIFHVHSSSPAPRLRLHHRAPGPFLGRLLRPVAPTAAAAVSRLTSYAALPALPRAPLPVCNSFGHPSRRRTTFASRLS